MLSVIEISSHLIIINNNNQLIPHRTLLHLDRMRTCQILDLGQKTRLSAHKHTAHSKLAKRDKKFQNLTGDNLYEKSCSL